MNIETTDALRGLVRFKIFSGALHEAADHDASGGVSMGSTCNVCERPIVAGMPEIQTFGIDPSRPRHHRRYHPKCHLMLSVELEDLAQR